ncbi:hypothetical protein SA496_20130 [Pseudomonas sp. JS3066]|uniref:hypothetical protein n=1 Tax=unclassified Pseudomonas TaxID=196821 RepID=UPI000EAAB847|nr:MULTISPECIES: hypothetical protein [unclassified Pseudomonas]AYF90395.1 hypothetical protein D6Z43_25865 [Pseudomonas sp. DY-1]MDH4653020.1 hypothetical protein [Pseudomonas sp. BN606]MRK22795.1 hypothetical protein [Pseudomonas sp. JG-B]WVK92010.1 hypothetical protein SA496_20130 [Pseudomonas sp. JS3066]
MSKTDKIQFHFVHFDGEITGEDRQPPTTREHRSLAINRSSIDKLIATRQSANTGDTLPSTRPPLADQGTEEVAPPQSFDSRFLSVDFSLPPSAEAVIAAEPLPESEERRAESQEAQVVDQDANQEAMVPLAISQPEPESWDKPGTEAEGNIEAEDLRSFRVELATQVPCEQPDAATSEQPEVGPIPQSTVSVSVGGEADNLLGDVQNTLDSLADMAKGLTQQKLDALKHQESLEQRKAQLQDKERLLADKEEQLRLLEVRLTREVGNLERSAEDNARALAERSAALKSLAENVEARDRSTARLAETLRHEKQRNDELTEALQRRSDALDEREAALGRKEDELAENLKQLIAAKDRFRALVKSFNETVQFNDTLNAISNTALDDSAH